MAKKSIFYAAVQFYSKRDAYLMELQKQLFIKLN